jgi:hypothetical protein
MGKRPHLSRRKIRFRRSSGVGVTCRVVPRSARDIEGCDTPSSRATREKLPVSPARTKAATKWPRKTTLKQPSVGAGLPR